MKKYLAMDIGCIECGESSDVIGVYKTLKQAEKAIEDYLDPDQEWGKKGRIGQHKEEIFEVDL